MKKPKLPDRFARVTKRWAEKLPMLQFVNLEIRVAELLRDEHKKALDALNKQRIDFLENYNASEQANAISEAIEMLERRTK